MFSEKILLLFSNTHCEPDYTELKINTIEEGLQVLISTFSPIFLEDIKNKIILDFGCGTGFQVVIMALNGAKFVFGVDIREKVLAEGINLAKKHNAYNSVEFLTEIGNNFSGHFDIILSQNSFEHYKNPDAVLKLWKRILKPKGKIYMTFGPPWYAPYGSHTHFFTKLPWVNLFFSESIVMKVRKNFRSDGATRYEEVEGGLNKMSVKKFETLIDKSGFTAEDVNYSGVKNMKFLTKLPIIRELFTNHISCIIVN